MPVCSAARMLAELIVAGVLPDRPEVESRWPCSRTAPLAYRRRLPLASFVVLVDVRSWLWPSRCRGCPTRRSPSWSCFFVSLYSLARTPAGRRRGSVDSSPSPARSCSWLTDGDPFARRRRALRHRFVGGPLGGRRRRSGCAGTGSGISPTTPPSWSAARAELAEAAVAEERSRIARELHDVVSHAISVTVLHARGGRRMLDVDPAEAREAFTVIERTNAQALGDMRRLLAVLRESAVDEEREPLPSLAALSTLVAAPSGLAGGARQSVGDPGGHSARHRPVRAIASFRRR